MNNIIKKTMGITLLVLMLAGCGNTAKLKDGTELIIEMDGVKMTTEDFYEKLKDTYGTYTLVNSIDELLLNKVYETDSDMETEIDSQVLTLKEQFGSDFEQAIYYYYGVSTESQLRDFIEMEIKRKLAINEYAETLIKEDDVKKYYDEKSIGDIKASHILIKSDAASDATVEEKTEAENKALETAKEIITKLNDGKDFAELAKEYSDDSSASDGGNLGYFNKGDMVSEFEDAAIALDVDEYTKEPVKTQYGYHVILKTDAKDKPKLDEIKSEIKETLRDELVANTSNISVYALEWLREKYDLKIYDAELKIRYDHYMNEQKSASTKTAE